MTDITVNKDALVGILNLLLEPKNNDWRPEVPATGRAKLLEKMAWLIEEFEEHRNLEALVGGGTYMEINKILELVLRDGYLNYASWDRSAREESRPRVAFTQFNF